VRTIEQGLPLVRAANTGISAVIDPLGRIVKSLPLGAEGVMDTSLPRRIDAPLYARTGDGGIFLLIGIALIFMVRRRLRHG
jgi:apolipoprotein N-acyltransferase